MINQLPDIKLGLIELRANIWKRLCLNHAIGIKESLGDDIGSDIYQYYGTKSFEALTLPGQLFTAIALANQPSNSYYQFLEELQEIDSKIWQAVSDNGISFHVLAQGDSFSASLFENSHPIDIDLEEWWKFIPNEERKELDLDQGGIQHAISRLSEGLCEEVREGLKRDFDLTVGEALTYLAPPEV